MTPSPFQEAFFYEVKSGSRSILLSAVAGSGKTTTIVHATSLLSPHVLTVFLAFNKRIADELESRVPKFIQVGTFHSRCLSALSRTLPKRPFVNKDKVRDILKKAVESKLLDYKESQAYFSFVTNLVSKAKTVGIGTELMDDSESSWQSLISHFGIQLDDPDASESRGIEIARRVLEKSNSDLSTIDYDDMLYLALLRGVNFDKASNLFVDEAQDTNGVQRALLKRMGNFNLQNTMVDDRNGSMVEMQISPSRLFAVGDSHQSIYGFRGASHDAMESIKNDFNCLELPLSISYRCSQAVVKEAQKYL